MQMNGNAELITIAKYWRQWRDPRLIVLVLNNRDLNQVTWEQRVLNGDPKYDASQSLPDFPYARYAELVGLRGIRVDEPNAIGAAWSRAMRADQPVVLEAYTDPNTPPLPPHVKFDQAKAYMSSLLKGDPQARGIIEQSAKEVAESLIPHRRQKH
jgi:pyruvate dehydrogenase (quinone)